MGAQFPNILAASVRTEAYPLHRVTLSSVSFCNLVLLKLKRFPVFTYLVWLQPSIQILQTQILQPLDFPASPAAARVIAHLPSSSVTVRLIFLSARRRLFIHGSVGTAASVQILTVVTMEFMLITMAKECNSLLQPSQRNQNDYCM